MKNARKKQVNCFSKICIKKIFTKTAETLSRILAIFTQMRGGYFLGMALAEKGICKSEKDIDKIFMGLMALLF